MGDVSKFFFDTSPFSCFSSVQGFTLAQPKTGIIRNILIARSMHRGASLHFEDMIISNGI